MPPPWKNFWIRPWHETFFERLIYFRFQVSTSLHLVNIQPNSKSARMGNFPISWNILGGMGQITGGYISPFPLDFHTCWLNFRKTLESHVTNLYSTDQKTSSMPIPRRCLYVDPTQRRLRPQIQFVSAKIRFSTTPIWLRIRSTLTSNIDEHGPYPE